MRTISFLFLALSVPAITHAQVEDEAVPRPAPEARRVRVADPWSTRGTVSAIGGVTGWSASGMPFVPEGTTASAESGALGIDMYGKRVGFHLALAGAVSESARSQDVADPRLRYTEAEGRLALTATLWNSYGIFVGVGPGVEARATGISNGAEEVSAWESVVAGGDLRARVFVGPHVILGGSAFAGVLPVAGEWQRADTIDAEAGQMESFVLAGSATVSVRPTEWIALTGGVALREATHTLETGEQGRESITRPFVGVQLLY